MPVFEMQRPSLDTCLFHQKTETCLSGHRIRRLLSCFSLVLPLQTFEQFRQIVNQAHLRTGRNDLVHRHITAGHIQRKFVDIQTETVDRKTGRRFGYIVRKPESTTADRQCTKIHDKRHTVLRVGAFPGSSDIPLLSGIQKGCDTPLACTISRQRNLRILQVDPCDADLARQNIAFGDVHFQLGNTENGCTIFQHGQSR